MQSELRRASNVITHTHRRTAAQGTGSAYYGMTSHWWRFLRPMVPIVTEEKSTVKCCPRGRGWKRQSERQAFGILGLNSEPEMSLTSSTTTKIMIFNWIFVVLRLWAPNILIDIQFIAQFYFISFSGTLLPLSTSVVKLNCLVWNYMAVKCQIWGQDISLDNESEPTQG